MHSIQRATTWKCLPGNWDTLHFSQLFPSDNEYGIPVMTNNGSIPAQLIQWGSRPKLMEVQEDGNTAVHFFLDDFRFESLWNNPERNLDVLMRIGMVLSPDFSLWRDMPLAMQIWNVYRNRWLGCFWQGHGIQVIPTISWSEPHDFCFAGVAQGSIVAISTVGVIRDKSAHRLFRAGFEKMSRVIKPEAILCYGDLSPLGIETDVVIFPTRWEQHGRANS